MKSRVVSRLFTSSNLHGVGNARSAKGGLEEQIRGISQGQETLNDITVITASLSCKERLGLPEGLREEERCRFRTKESIEGLDDDHADDALESRGEPFRAMRGAKCPVVSWMCSLNGLKTGSKEIF